MCWLILGGLEVHWITFRWVFWWLKANCHILLYAASSVTKKALAEGQDVNFFDFFWCFPNYCIKMNGKMPLEKGKVTKLVFWATLQLAKIYLARVFVSVLESPWKVFCGPELLWWVIFFVFVGIFFLNIFFRGDH